MASYPTRRKIRIIEKELGADWKSQYAGQSIDAVYNMVTGDQRKNLFCKIDPDLKGKLDEMVEYHDMKMASMVEKMILEEYDKYMQERDARVAHIASQFAMST